MDLCSRDRTWWRDERSRVVEEEEEVVVVVGLGYRNPKLHQARLAVDLRYHKLEAEKCL